MDRRKFLKLMGMTGVAAAIPWQLRLRDYKLMMAQAYPFSQSPTIRKFITNLPGLGPSGPTKSAVHPVIHQDNPEFCLPKDRFLQPGGKAIHRKDAS